MNLGPSEIPRPNSSISACSWNCKPTSSCYSCPKTSARRDWADQLFYACPNLFHLPQSHHSRPQRTRSFLVAILGADQKERGLWGRECPSLLTYFSFQNNSSLATVILQHCFKNGDFRQKTCVSGKLLFSF